MLKRTTMTTSFKHPYCVQAHQPPDQAAQSHIHPVVPADAALEQQLIQPMDCSTRVMVPSAGTLPVFLAITMLTAAMNKNDMV